MDPYGGPHGRRVAAAHNAHLTSQWFADHGFAVIVADGRGAPGRSPAWEKAVRDDFVLTLDDQIEALHALAGRFPLDLDRVAIRGWSYGVTSPASRCCAAPTCSTRPWWAPR